MSDYDETINVVKKEFLFEGMVNHYFDKIISPMFEVSYHLESDYNNSDKRSKLFRGMNFVLAFSDNSYMTNLIKVNGGCLYSCQGDVDLIICLVGRNKPNKHYREILNKGLSCYIVSEVRLRNHILMKIF